MGNRPNFHLPTYRPLTRCSLEELAYQQQMNERRAHQHGGVMFARKTEWDQKNKARDAIIELLTPERFPEPFSLLTMPGLSFGFETRLLRLREPNWNKSNGLRSLKLTCIENDRYIYYSAVTRLLGMRRSPITTLQQPDYAETAVGNSFVTRFLFANVDDLMLSGESFDVAWLDYTGPLSVDRMKSIQQFWRQNVQHILVITSLKARWNWKTSRTIERHGGCIQWQRNLLQGHVLHELEYQDGHSPMAQFAISKE